MSPWMFDFRTIENDDEESVRIKAINKYMKESNYISKSSGKLPFWNKNQNLIKQYEIWRDETSSNIDSVSSRNVNLSALMQSASSQSREPSEDQRSRKLDETPLSFKKDLSSKRLMNNDDSLVLMLESDSLHQW